MDFTVTCSVKNGCIIAKIDAPQAGQYTQYAYYLYDSSVGVIQKQGYIAKNEFAFRPEKSGRYYVRGFVRDKATPEGEYVKESKLSNKVNCYVTVQIRYEELDSVVFPVGIPTIYDIMWDGVHFEFLIHVKPDSTQAVIFGTGDVGDRKNMPRFDRCSWTDDITTTAIYYSDPTIYLGDSTLGWGYGTNDRWYLEDMAVLLYKFLTHLGIKTADTLFYGSSAGGYMSACLAAMLHSRATVINPQLIVENFWPRLVDRFQASCLKPGEDILSERLRITDIFQREQYFPRLHIVQNTEAERDMTMQITPFLTYLNKFDIDYTERVILDFYTAEGGHGVMPSKDDCLKTIAEDLMRPLNNQEPSPNSPYHKRIARAISNTHHINSQEAESLREQFLGMYQTHPIPLPQVYFRSDTLVDVADKLMGGTLCIYHNLEQMPYALDTLDWNVQYGAQPNTFLLHLQGLTPVPALIGAYIQTKKLDYLQYARKFVEAWHRYIQDPAQKKNRYCWADHAVNLRASTLIYLGRVAAQDDLWEDAFYVWLLERLEEHGACLKLDETYLENHNHGVMQDQGLLYIAVFLQREDWINHAVERLLRQAKWAFNDEGVHKENSSGYAQLISRMFRSIGQFLLDSGIERGQEILNAIQGCEEYLSWLTLPNGKLVQIGDTQLIKSAVPVQKYEHKFYPNAGMYFYRSGPKEDPAFATYKVVKAGYEATTHKHCDDLSFVLYSKGREIFADAGVYGYARNEYRAYVISAMAHNTIVVDDKTYAATMENAACIGMEGYRAFLRYDHVRLFQNAYPGVRITRDFFSADDLTILVDTVESQQNHVYSQLFHLAEDIEVLQAEGHEVVLWLAYSGYTVRLRQFGSPVKLNVIKGNLSRPGYGLISRGTNHLAVTTTLKFDMEGASGKFVTAITIEDKDGDVRLGNYFARGESLSYDANTRTFAIGNLTIPCDRLLTPTKKYKE